MLLKGKCGDVNSTRSFDLHIVERIYMDKWMVGKICARSPKFSYWLTHGIEALQHIAGRENSVVELFEVIGQFWIKNLSILDRISNKFLHVTKKTEWTGLGAFEQE